MYLPSLLASIVFVFSIVNETVEVIYTVTKHQYPGLPCQLVSRHAVHISTLYHRDKKISIYIEVQGGAGWKIHFLNEAALT